MKPIQVFKHFVRSQLFNTCRFLVDLSALIQTKILQMTLEEKRCQTNMSRPVETMDLDLLSMYIRFIGHNVEKAVRYKKTTSARGTEKPKLLRLALDEWYRRQYPRRKFIEWAENNLSDYENWQLTGEPQIHSEKGLYPLNENSTIIEVLTNRVSTRFFKPIEVPDELIWKILRVGMYAPTSCNRQTWKLYVQKNKKRANDLHAGVANKTLWQTAPVVIYITIDHRLYPEKWAAAEDAGIIGLQLNLAAVGFGLGTCLMYGGDEVSQKNWRALLKLPDHFNMYLILLLGYPAERTLTDKRASAEDITVFL